MESFSLTVIKGCPSLPPAHENLPESASGSESVSRSALRIESRQEVSGAVLDCDPDTDADWDEMQILTANQPIIDLQEGSIRNKAMQYLGGHSPAEDRLEAICVGLPRISRASRLLALART